MQQVLVVDDEANIRKVLSAQIKAAGYEVLEATNGLEALALIQQGEIDGIRSARNEVALYVRAAGRERQVRACPCIFRARTPA